MANVKSARTATRARSAKTETVASPAPRPVMHSAYIAKCVLAGVMPADGDGLPCREQFRDRCRAANAWHNGTSSGGPHSVVTDLHDWVIASRVDRMGDHATPVGRKMRDAIRARGIPAAWDNAQWDIDVSARRAAFRAARKRRG